MKAITNSQWNWQVLCSEEVGKLCNGFTFSASIILLLTGAAKLISAFGTAHILQIYDPILKISFRDLFFLVGSVEVIVGAICLFYGAQRRMLQASLIAWLATNFVIYRLSLVAVGYQKPCSCLGNLTGYIHVPAETADVIMKVVLTYLLVGSYLTLLFCLKHKQTNKQHKT